MRNVNLLLCILLLGAYAVAQADTPQPEITVHNLTLNTSSNGLPSSDQQQTIQDILGRKYASDVADEITERVLYGIQMRGFFKAQASRPSVTVISETPQQKVVDMALSVNLGEQYRLKAISFTHERVLTDSELRAQFAIADGDIFNVEEIRQGLDALRKTYASKGYINFTPVPYEQTDDAAHTVSLTVDMDEGVQFRIGPLVLDGVEAKPGAGAQLLANWKEYQGQIYDPAFPEKFLRDNGALLPAGITAQNLAITQDVQARVLFFRLELPDPVDVNR